MTAEIDEKTNLCTGLGLCVIVIYHGFEKLNIICVDCSEPELSVPDKIKKANLDAQAAFNEGVHKTRKIFNVYRTHQIDLN